MKNVVSVSIGYSQENDLRDGEYDCHLVGIVGHLDICSPGGVDDVSLIKEAVDEWVCENADALIREHYSAAAITLTESGEREDVFWHKYYVVTESQIY